MTLRQVASSALRGLVTLVPIGRTTVAFCLGLCQWSSLAFVMVATLPESGVSTKCHAASHCAVWFIPAARPAMGSVGLSLKVTLATANFASSYAPEAHQSQTTTRGTLRTPVTSKWELPDTLKQLTPFKTTSAAAPRMHRERALRLDEEVVLAGSLWAFRPRWLDSCRCHLPGSRLVGFCPTAAYRHAETSYGR